MYVCTNQSQSYLNHLVHEIDTHKITELLHSNCVTVRRFKYKSVATYILCAVCTQTDICLDLCDPNGSSPDEAYEV